MDGSSELSSEGEEHHLTGTGPTEPSFVQSGKAGSGAGDHSTSSVTIQAQRNLQPGFRDLDLGSTQAVRDYHVHVSTAGISKRRSIKERLQGSRDDEPTKRRIGKEIMDGSSELSTKGEEHHLTGTGPTEPSFVQSGKSGTGAGDHSTSSLTIQAQKNLQLGFRNLDVGSTRAVRDYVDVSTAGIFKRQSIKELLQGSAPPTKGRTGKEPLQDDEPAKHNKSS